MRNFIFVGIFMVPKNVLKYLPLGLFFFIYLYSKYYANGYDITCFSRIQIFFSGLIEKPQETPVPPGSAAAAGTLVREESVEPDP